MLFIYSAVVEASWIELFLFGSFVFIISIIIKRYFRKTPITPIPKRQSFLTKNNEFTLSELKQYDGTDPTKPILIAIKGIIKFFIILYIYIWKGKVYDVSSKESFYGPNGPYHTFAGKDASRALAKGVVDVYYFILNNNK